MRDPDLFGRIDRVLAECDARQLPPLTAAIDPAGTAEHLVVVETATGRIVHPPATPITQSDAGLRPGHHQPRQHAEHQRAANDPGGWFTRLIKSWRHPS